MRHQQSFSSISSGGGTPNQLMSTLSFNKFGQGHPTQSNGPTTTKQNKTEESKSHGHHHHGLFHRHHSPSQAHSTPGKRLVIDNEEIILDTDLGKLQGIVSNKAPQSLPDVNHKNSIGDVSSVAPWETSPRFSSIAPTTIGSASDATWTAPESWGVRPHNSIVEDLQDFPDDDNVVSSRQTYCLRVFRTDSTFATVQCPTNISVNELITLLTKKFFVSANEPWVLVHYVNNLARIMQPGERPVTLQQKTLQRLGYVEDEDCGGEMGRDDWSGFWRFVFMKADGLSSIAVLPQIQYS
jgi:hypothetical protein